MAGMRSAHKPCHTVLRDNADAADATRRLEDGGVILPCAGRGEDCDGEQVNSEFL